MGGIDLQKYWIHGILSGDPRYVEGRGFDLNGNGHVDETELLEDCNQNRTVGDAEDYQKYLEKYRRELSAAIPFFRWGAFLQPDNPFHTLMYYYSDLYPPQLLEGAYQFIGELLAQAVTLGKDALEPENNLLAIHRGMRNLNVTFTESDDTGLPEDVQKRKFRCDKQSFATLAVGHEMGLPIFAVLLPGHTVVRWGNQFFVDAGEIQTEEDYVKRFSITPPQKTEGVFLSNLDPKKLSAHFLFDRGLILSRRKNFEGAKEAYEQAIRWHDRFPGLHNNLGIVLLNMGRPKEALVPLSKAVLLDEGNTKVRFNLATALFLSGMPHEAVDHLKEVIRRDPTDEGAKEMLDRISKSSKGRPRLQQPSNDRLPPL